MIEGENRVKMLPQSIPQTMLPLGLTGSVRGGRKNT